MARILLLFAVAAAVFAGGCSHPPAPRPAPLTENAHFRGHAEILKKTLSPLRMAGAFITPDTYENYRYTPEELVRRLRMAGITQVYLQTESYEVKDFGAEFPVFLKHLRNSGIPVWIAISDHIIYEKPEESFVYLSTLAHDYDKHLYQRITDFSAVDNVFGIALALTPHINSSLRRRGLYAWSESTYGIGGDNDQLIRQSIKLAADIRRKFRSKPLALVIPEFYHGKAVAGELSAGRIADFLPLADQVVVTAFDDRIDGHAASLRPQLEEAASLGKQLIVCLPAGYRLQSRRFRSLGDATFGGFMNQLSLELRNIQNEPGLGGLAFMNFRGVEILLEKPE